MPLGIARSWAGRQCYERARLFGDVRADVLKFHFGFQAAELDELSFAFQFQFDGQQVGVGGAGGGAVGDAGGFQQAPSGFDVAAAAGVADSSNNLLI